MFHLRLLSSRDGLESLETSAQLLKRRAIKHHKNLQLPPFYSLSGPSIQAKVAGNIQRWTLDKNREKEKEREREREEKGRHRLSWYFVFGLVELVLSFSWKMLFIFFWRRWALTSRDWPLALSFRFLPSLDWWFSLFVVVVVDAAAVVAVFPVILLLFPLFHSARGGCSVQSAGEKIVWWIDLPLLSKNKKQNGKKNYHNFFFRFNFWLEISPLFWLIKLKRISRRL